MLQFSMYVHALFEMYMLLALCILGAIGRCTGGYSVRHKVTGQGCVCPGLHFGFHGGSTQIFKRF